jgi:hypothetical protein
MFILSAMSNSAVWTRLIQALAALALLINAGTIAGETLLESHERAGLPNAFARLASGQPTRIAYLGGSITAQAGWRPKTLTWFRNQFPNAKIEEINAAIGGTGSDLGVFRLGHDVLEREPDLLFVEFAVNDSGAPPAQIHRCMEGIVRQTWKARPGVDVCFVYTLAGNMLEDLKQEGLPRSIQAMEQVAEHYAIPSVNMGLEVARLEKAGRLVFKGDLPKAGGEPRAAAGPIIFSPDSVHPYPETGHELYRQAVVRFLEKARSKAEPAPHPLPAPFVADNWELAKMVPLSRAQLSSGWQRLDPAHEKLAKAFGDRLPELWKATEPGQTIRFRFRGPTARIYDLLGPDCGQVRVKVDEGPARVQPRFDSFCTYHRLASLSVAESLSNTLHQIELTIDPEQPDKVRILSQRQEKMDDPKRYDGTTWYAGALLLIGELVE